jgi:hypothetical protein
MSPVRGPFPSYRTPNDAPVEAVARELAAATKQPPSRQPLTDLTARLRSALGDLISRTAVRRVFDQDARHRFDFSVPKVWSAVARRLSPKPRRVSQKMPMRASGYEMSTKGIDTTPLLV